MHCEGHTCHINTIVLALSQSSNNFADSALKYNWVESLKSRPMLNENWTPLVKGLNMREHWVKSNAAPHGFVL